MSRRIAVVTRSGILTATGDEGEGWSTETTATDQRPECVLIDDRRPDRLFVGTFEDGLWVSHDAGSTFESVGATRIEPDSVTAMAVDPTDGDHLLLGTEPSRLYQSDDGGERWRQIVGLTDVPSADEWSFPPRPSTHHVRWIEIDPADPSRWYIGIEAGALVYTPDAGETWHDRPPGSRRDNHTLATHPDAPGRVYSAAGDGYAESLDAGASWETMHQGLDHRYVWGLAVDTGDPETVIVSAATGASNAHRTPGDAHLYRRGRDAGGWTHLEDCGVPTGAGERRAVLSAGPAAGEFIAATDGGLYRSLDGGQQWDRLDIEFGSIGNSLPRGLAVTSPT